MTASSVTCGFQRDRIAAAGHAHRLRVDGGGAILADHAVGSFIKADAAADFAGVKQGGDFSIGLLVEPEADFDPAFFGLEAMQFAIVNLLQRDRNFAIDES